MMPAVTDQLRPSLAAARASLISEIVRTLLIALIAFVALRMIVLPYQVEGPSMEPTLENGELLLVGRQAYFHFDLNRALNYVPFVHREGQHVVFPFGAPHRGDIVILHPPFKVDKPYVKRIVGLPGDHLSFQSGAVFVNGRQLNEPYLLGVATIWTGPGDGQNVVVPPGRVFVMGDNRGNSSDSRFFGTVPIDSLIGKTWVTLWPADRLGIIGSPDYAR